METASCKGQLVKWKDDRGFGFIKPETESKEIFLHISALAGATRRPKVGDTILYDQVIGKDGKISAANASIQGALSQTQNVNKSQRTKSQYSPAKQKTNQKNSLQIGGSILGIAMFSYLVISSNRSFFNPNVSSPSPSNVTVSVPNVSKPSPSNVTVSVPNVSKPSPSNATVSVPNVSKPSPSNATVSVPNISSPSPSNATVSVPNTSSGCNIKGNISFSSGEKFYHLQGMPEYEITKIDTSKGERFFCSESEASASGWRKAPR